MENINVMDGTVLDPSAVKIELIRSSEITPVPMEWLWNGWLAKGKLHTIAGNAGTGKTTIAISAASTISSGSNWPDHSPSHRAKVLIWSGEDCIEDTLQPRLLAHNASTENIYFINAMTDSNGYKRQFDPSTDIYDLEQNIKQLTNVALIVINPIVSVVKRDSNNNGDVRRALQPLIDLATKYNIAIIGISHFSKGTLGKVGLERVTGSLAFGAAARLVLATAKIKDSNGNDAYVLARIKSNLSEDQGGFYYQIQKCNPVADLTIESSKIVWGEIINGDASYLLSQEPPNHKKLLARAEAKEFLINLLSNGVQRADDILNAAKADLISEATLKRAKKDLGIISVRLDLEKKMGMGLAITNTEDHGPHRRSRRIRDPMRFK